MSTSFVIVLLAVSCVYPLTVAKDCGEIGALCEPGEICRCGANGCFCDPTPAR
ncbi:hypothetical protein AAVH_09136, partial [Aphelenchoides avenae]